jgi:hypothetical protein
MSGIKESFREMIEKGVSSQLMGLVNLGGMQKTRAFVRLMELLYCKGFKDLEDIVKLLSLIMAQGSKNWIDILKQALNRRKVEIDENFIELIVSCKSAIHSHK